jgi:hypothetical protein
MIFFQLSLSLHIDKKHPSIFDLNSITWHYYYHSLTWTPMGAGKLKPYIDGLFIKKLSINVTNIDTNDKTTPAIK